MVQVDLTLTYPVFHAETEVLNFIEVSTYSSSMPPYGPHFWKDVINPGNQELNTENQLDFRVTLNYPHNAPTEQYALNIKIDGSYE